MLIWKGHGVLILVFGVAGAIAAGMVCGGLFSATNWTFMGRLMICAPFWGAAAAIWLYAKTMGKPTEQTFLDPATHRPVILRKSHSLFFIPPVPWAIIASVVALGMTGPAFLVPGDTFDIKAGASGPGASAFEEANHLISIYKDKEAHGNTPDAEKLAAEFAAIVKLGRKLGVQAATKSSFSLSKGRFLTYCRINPDSCAFMVHVPDLRKFSQDAKEFFADIAWATALESARSLEPQPSKVALGVRGAFLYDRVMVGHIVAEDSDPDTGIEKRFTSAGSEKNLAEFFKDVALDAALPRLKTDDEPVAEAAAKKTADTASQKALPSVPAGITPPPSATASSMPSPSAPPSGASANGTVSPSQKVEILLKWFPTTKAGEVAGNADAVNELALKYAGFVHDRVSVNPSLGGMSLPDPCFSAYVHLRDDTAAFLLALPAGSDLSPAAFNVIQDEAWRMAAMASAQMLPIPVRIAVVTFNEGQMDMTRIGSPRNPEGTEWLVEQELKGKQGKDVLAPFVAVSSKPLITVKSPLTLQTSVKSLLSATRHVRAAERAPAEPAAAPASAPLLPTPVRDWKDTSGRVMQASLESFTTPVKDVGRFKRADGQVFEVPFSRLSAEDQAFIRSLAAPSKP